MFRQANDGSEKALSVSVIVPTFNRRQTLQVCLLSLAHQTLSDEEWEVIVVDDGSTDGTDSFLRDVEFPIRHLQYLRQENSGAGAARRRGVETAQGKLLVFLNDDTVACTRLLEEHLATHKKNPRSKVAVLGSFYASEDCNRSALSLWLQRSTFLFPQNAMKAGDLHDCGYFITCNLSISREAVQKAGSFDASLRVGEDTELGARLARLGYRVHYHPKAVAIHEHPVFTTGDLIRRARIYGPASLYLYRKHPELLRVGSSPFGTLREEDFQRMASFVDDKRVAATAAVTALEALDPIDLVELSRRNQLREEDLRELVEKVAQLAPLVYWHSLFESLLAARAAEIPTQPHQPLVPAVVSS